MVSTAKIWGGFVAWVLKGCKTKLKDEIHQNDLRNYIIGYVVAGIIIGLLYLLLSYKYSGE